MSGGVISERNNISSENRLSNHIHSISLDEHSDDVSNIIDASKLKKTKQKKIVSSSIIESRKARRAIKKEKEKRGKVSKNKVGLFDGKVDHNARIKKKIKDLGYETDNEDKKYKIKEFDRLLGFDENIPEINVSLRKLFIVEQGRARRSFSEDKARYQYKINEIKKCIDLINDAINTKIPIPYSNEFHKVKGELHREAFDDKSLLDNSVFVEHEGLWNLEENKNFSTLQDGVVNNRVLNKIYIYNPFGMCAANAAAQYLYRYIPKFKEEYPLHVADDSDMWRSNNARMITENTKIIEKFIKDMCPEGKMVYQMGYYIKAYLDKKGYSDEQIHKHMSSVMFNGATMNNEDGSHAIYRINDNYVMNDSNMTKLSRKNINYSITDLFEHIAIYARKEGKLNELFYFMKKHVSSDSLMGVIADKLMNV